MLWRRFIYGVSSEIIWREREQRLVGIWYKEPSKANILKVYDEMDKKQIFGTKEIAKY